MLKKIFNYETLERFIFFTFVLSVIFVTIRIIQAPTVSPDGHEVRVKGDYVLMLLQCIVGIFAMLLPNFLHKRLRLNIPSNMLICYAIFLYCAIFLGEVRSFYYNIPHWDTILHTFSGGALGALGFSLVSLLNNSESVPINLSPAFVSIFAFCFAVSLGVIWEVYEFSGDYFLHTNMQKFALENGTSLVGQAALADTMKDLIVDMAGAATMSIVGYLAQKTHKGWLEKFQLRVEK